MTNKNHILVIYLLAVAIVFRVWLKSVGNPVIYMASTVPEGQGYYVLSKLMGLISLVIFALQGLSGVYKHFFNSIFPEKAHRYLGSVVFAAMILHVAGFITATTIRSGYFTGHLLLPDVDDFYHSRITVGVVALLFTVIAVSSKAMRNQTVSKYLHWLTIPAVYLASWHALSIGTESRTPIIQGLVFIILTALSIGIIRNLIQLRIQNKSKN